MHQSHDGAHAQLSDAAEPPVGPAPVEYIAFSITRALPQYGISNCTKPELSKQIQVVYAGSMTGPLDLIEIPVPYSIHRAFDSGPELEPTGSATTHCWVGLTTSLYCFVRGRA